MLLLLQLFVALLQIVVQENYLFYFLILLYLKFHSHLMHQNIAVLQVQHFLLQLDFVLGCKIGIQILYHFFYMMLIVYYSILKFLSHLQILDHLLQCPFLLICLMLLFFLLLMVLLLQLVLLFLFQNLYYLMLLL